MISIIIRTKNEERWIGSCLEALSRQSRSDFEVVLVDNNSTDKTVDKALNYGVILVNIDEYRPGAAINRGIEASNGDVIVVLSGHCIPVDEQWLDNLVQDLGDDSVAGVYGRQEPLAFSSDHDKRDLLMTFGLDKRVQIKDSLFHNANSAFRRSVWKTYPFDEQVTNIEDRLWAHQVLGAGLKIVYEPTASVFHHHGIHHDGDPTRCENIVDILESIGQDENQTASNKIVVGHLNVVLVIPVREEGLLCLAGKPLYEYAIEHAKQSVLVKTIAVSTDNEAVGAKALDAGVDIVLSRPEGESRFDVILELLMQSSLSMLEEQGNIPDVLVMLEPTFPFRDEDLIDKLVSRFVEGGFDTVIPARTEYNSCWMGEQGSYRRVDSGYIARQFKTPFLTGLKGLCCVCSPATVREGQLFGENVGLLQLEDVIPTIEVRSSSDVLLAETILASPRYSGEETGGDDDSLFNVGIVGLGHVAAHQIAAINSSRDFRLTAGCDPDATRHAVLGRAVNAYTDFEDLLKQPDIDVVVIASPNRLHIAHGIQVMAAGKWLFMEKPLAETEEEFDEFDRARKEYSAQCTFALHAAFGQELEWYCKTNDDLDDIRSIEAEFLDPYIVGGQLEQRAASLGGSWLDSGINALSVICRLISPDDLVIRDSRLKRIDGLACAEVQGSVEFEFSRPQGPGKGSIKTSWTAGRDKKRTILGFNGGDRKILLDHSAQRVVLHDQGQDQLLYSCDNMLPRLTNHYVEAFKDLAAQMQAGKDNFSYGKKLHQFLYRVEELAD